MNVWKPIAIIATTGLIVSIGVQTAHAMKSSDPHPTKVEGACFDQPNMAAAKASLESALNSLNHAEHNKGGWRDAAVQSTQTALARTTEGCRSANGH
jgi:hypothetical protein